VVGLAGGLAALALLAAEAGTAADAPQVTEREEPDVISPRHHLRAGAAAGLGAGFSVLPPVPYALPWLELEAAYDLRLTHVWAASARLDLALGPSPDGGTAIGGYFGVLELEREWFATGFVRLSSAGRVGVVSFALVPLPLVGLGHTLAFTHVDREHFVWSTGFDLNTDAVLLPVLSGGAWTRATARAGGFELSLRLKGAWGASLLKGVGVSAGAQLGAGVRF
jgi:hypothetical protein